MSDQLGDDVDGGIDRRSFFGGALLGFLGAFISVNLSGTASAVDMESPPGGSGQSDLSYHTPAEIEVRRAENPRSGMVDEWQVRVDIGSLRDDDRVIVEPSPSGLFHNPATVGGQLHISEANEGDEVLVYSIAFDGPTTVHFRGDVTDLEDVTCEVHRYGGCDDGE